MNTVKPTRSEANRIALVFWLAAFFALCLGELSLIQHYYPVNDEMVMLTTSAAPFHPDPVDWIRTGFSRYFMAYPGWYTPFSSYLRPVWNAAYYVNSLLFGAHWGYYLLSNYFLHALMAALVVWIGLLELSLTRTKALLAGLMILVCPAFIPKAFFYPCFASDILTSVWVIAGFIALRARRYVWCWIALLLAVFTKEPALGVPVAVACYILLTPGLGRFQYRSRLAAVMLIPTALWVIVRMLVFGPVAHAYAVGSLTGITGTLKTVAKGLLHWPTGVVLRGSRLTLAAGAGFNAVFWLVAAVCLWRYLASRKSVTGLRADLAAWNDVLQLGLFAGATGVLLVFLSAPPRFGACFYPWFVLLIFYCWQWWPFQPFPLAGALCLVCITTGGIWQKRNVFTADKARMERRSEMSRKFVDVVAGSGADVIFVVDDIVGGFDNMDAVRKFSGTRARLIKLDDLNCINEESAVLLDDDAANCTPTPSIRMSREGDHRFTITSTLNQGCMNHDFDAAFLDLVFSGSPDSKVRRVEKPYTLKYSPGALQRAVLRHETLDTTPLDPVPMTVEVEGPLANAQVLVPDLCHRNFRTVSLR
jgi:hypothetical protein